MKPGIAELLRSMPDLEPPKEAWDCIVRQEKKHRWLRRGGGFAMAASVVIAIAAGVLYFGQSFHVPPSVEQAGVRPLIVSAPASQPAEREIDPALRALQRRSQYMERLIGDLPRRSQRARADMAGVIAELEDRIAAVDYQLNRAATSRAGLDRRQFEQPRYGPADTPDLWRRRVEYMDQLVRARYVEAGAAGF